MTTRKILGNAAPQADTWVELYSSPTEATLSTLIINNRVNNITKYAVAIVPGEDTRGPEHLIYGPDHLFPGSNTLVVSLGCPLESGASVWVWGQLNSLSFSLYGMEHD